GRVGRAEADGDLDGVVGGEQDVRGDARGHGVYTLFEVMSPSRWTALPSIRTFVEPGETIFALPGVVAETKPPPVPLLAMSPVLSNEQPLTATALPSILTVLV